MEKDKETKASKEAKSVKVDGVKLLKQLAELQVEKDELFRQLQRVSADYANFQKRAPKQIAASVSYEKEKVIKSILPVLDNFEHTLGGAESVESTEVLIKGIEIIHDQILGILKSHNVEQIKAVGEKFDPAEHEAIMQREDENCEDGIVLEEFQKGYKLNGRVLRPCKVVVSKSKAEQSAAERPESEDEKQQ